MDDILPDIRVEKRILSIRGLRVLLDSDLAQLYGVPVKRLNEQVSRNISRFPSDFMFQMTDLEFDFLRSQIATLKKGSGRHRKYPPYVFTEQGVAMLSSVLKSERAVQVNILIMRAFVHLREMIASHRDLARRLDDLEKRYDEQFKVVFDAIRELMEHPGVPGRRIGFQP